MSEIKVDTLTGKTTANDITVTVGASATQSLEQGLAKAFCTTDGDTTVTDSLNISSATDDGSGDNSFVVTNNMGSSTWCVSALARSDDNAGRRGAFMQFAANTNYMASHFTRIHCNYENTSAREPEYICVVFHGELA